MVYRNPVYHQVVFATIVLSAAARVTYLLKWSDRTVDIPDKTKATIGKVFSSGAALFAFGFLIWNLDNVYCDTLTHWKVSIGWPCAFLLEGMLSSPPSATKSYNNASFLCRTFLVAYIHCEFKEVSPQHKED
jgi:hypothetical protein